MFTDTHCHILKEYYENIEEIIDRAKKNGIMKMIVNGIDRKSNEEVLELQKKYDCIYAAIGFHPENISDFQENNLQQIENNISSIVAIGEIGLDYHYEPCDKEAQQNLFESQLQLAEKYHKPVIIHSRDATQDTIDILKRHPNVKGCLHCFSGSLETAKIYVSMGFAKLKEIIKAVPLDTLLLETDSPYLSPEPKRGTKNEPANIRHIANFIADELKLDIRELSEVTEANVKALFDI